MIYKCLTRADRGDEGCMEGETKKNGEVEKEEEMGEDRNGGFEVGDSVPL